MRQREMDTAKVIAMSHWDLGLPDTRALALNQHATQTPWRDGETEARGKVCWGHTRKGK